VHNRTRRGPPAFLAPLALLPGMFVRLDAQAKPPLIPEQQQEEDAASGEPRRPQQP
jgi:hypothetical protein